MFIETLPLDLRVDFRFENGAMKETVAFNGVLILSATVESTVTKDLFWLLAPVFIRILLL